MTNTLKKKVVLPLILGVLLMFGTSVHAYTGSVSPNPVGSTADNFSITTNCTSANDALVVFTPNGSALNEFSCDAINNPTSIDLMNYAPIDTPNGIYSVAFFSFIDGQDPPCIANSYGVPGSFVNCSSEYTSTFYFIVGSAVFTAQSATEIINSAQVGEAINYMMIGFMVVIGGLLALGWGYRAIKRHVTGNKF